MIQAAQKADPVLSQIILQLAMAEPDPQVPADECSNEYKVISHQSKHLSVSEAGGGEIPEGVLFY